MPVATDSECLFCKIVAREIPADIVHESDAILAFRDIQPKAPTHILLIPKEHLASIANVGEDRGEVLGELARAAAHLAKAEGIDRSGWRLVTNVGPDAGQ